MLKKFFKQKHIKETKSKTNEHNNRQNVNIASETGKLINRDGKQKSIFERKVQTRILGPVYDNEKEN